MDYLRSNIDLFIKTSPSKTSKILQRLYQIFLKIVNILTIDSREKLNRYLPETLFYGILEFFSTFLHRITHEKDPVLFSMKNSTITTEKQRLVFFKKSNPSQRSELLGKKMSWFTFETLKQWWYTFSWHCFSRRKLPHLPE